MGENLYQQQSRAGVNIQNFYRITETKYKEIKLQVNKQLNKVNGYFQIKYKWPITLSKIIQHL